MKNAYYLHLLILVYVQCSFQACDERVGHEDVVADLAAPFDLQLCALDIRDLVQMLTLFDLNQLRAQHAHTCFTVLELVTLRLAGDNNAGRLVDETHGGTGLVDVLSACTGRAVDLLFTSGVRREKLVQTCLS